MEGLTIRALGPGDAPALAALVEALNADQRDPTDYFNAAIARAEALAARPAFRGFIAEAEGAPAGYALYCEAYESSYAAAGYYLCDLYVVPAQRRRGLGRALVARLAARARADGRSYLWWASKPDNAAARAFYDRLGATSEPVFAHALAFDAFAALAREGGASPERDAARDGMRSTACAPRAKKEE